MDKEFVAIVGLSGVVAMVTAAKANIGVLGMPSEEMGLMVSVLVVVGNYAKDRLMQLKKAWDESGEVVA